MGTLNLYAQNNCIIRLDFKQSFEAEDLIVKYLTNRAVEEGSCPVLEELRAELDEYFAGSRIDFTVPHRLHGTDFQRRVWEQLRMIPYGQTVTYGQLAARIDQPKASRAVGGANHNNPISIVIPCHRVIGAGGHLTGYGGGLERKEFLLRLEQTTLTEMHKPL